MKEAKLGAWARQSRLRYPAKGPAPGAGPQQWAPARSGWPVPRQRCHRPRSTAGTTAAGIAVHHHASHRKEILLSTTVTIAQINNLPGVGGTKQ